jgi:hypothetical protein
VSILDIYIFGANNTEFSDGAIGAWHCAIAHAHWRMLLCDISVLMINSVDLSHLPYYQSIN